MKRRSFLKSAAAVFPAVGLQGFPLREAAAQSASAVELHPVGAGEDRFGETHSLGYSTILFKVVPRETSGGLLVIEHNNLVKGGPPVHFHLHQDEWFYVMEGEVVFQVGDTRKRLSAGESMLGPRGIPHGFSAVSATPSRMLIAFTPAGKMEEFFRVAAVPSGPKMDADLFSRYDMQYVGPPIVVG
jgi:quercetin dioxygenase-like cupin family protein